MINEDCICFSVVFMNRKRQQNLEIAKQLEKEGKLAQAQDYYYRAIEITPDLYLPIIRRLRLLNIDFTSLIY